MDMKEAVKPTVEQLRLSAKLDLIQRLTPERARALADTIDQLASLVDADRRLRDAERRLIKTISIALAYLVGLALAGFLLN